MKYEELYDIDSSQDRATPKEQNDGILLGLVDNLQELEKNKLFRQIQIYQRDQICVYTSQIDETSVAEVIQECLFGKWSKVEEEVLREVKECLK